MRYFKVNLGGIDPWMYVNSDCFLESSRRWTQPPEHWTLICLEHAGQISVNNRAIAFSVGDVAFIAPGAKVEFGQWGDATDHYKFTFAIRSRSEEIAIPVVASLGETLSVRRLERQRAYDLLQFSIMPSIAFVLNLLWSICEPSGVYRRSDIITDAESIILKNLGQPIEIKALAAELGISHSQLLRLFREEHGSTVQEFVREKRVEIARKLLTESRREIKEIACLAGMPDLQHFNKVIRSSTGLSPRALRRQSEDRTRH